MVPTVSVVSCLVPHFDLHRPLSSMMMDRILLALLYLSGWKISTCLRQYHYVTNHMTWTEAQAYCREEYTDLATIENQDELNQLMNTLSSSGYKSEVWIGLFSNIDWRWSDNYGGSGAEYRNWEISDEPDFVSAQQFCVNIGNSGEWWDDTCSIEYPFICYRGTQQDPEFVVSNESMTWSSAQRHCRDTFVDLATVRNDSENQRVRNLVPGGEWAWIGLAREPHIYWSDLSGFSFSYWDNRRNLIGSMKKVCGVVVLWRSGKWRFQDCEFKNPFVCYRATSAPVMRQVVKLRMKPGDSSVDLNDPAVKADLLKKLQDRLEEKGVTGVTLKWREQPDGNVFHKEGKPQRKKRKLRSKVEL